MKFKDYNGNTYEINNENIDKFIEHCKNNPTCGFCYRGGYEAGPGFFDFGHCEVFDEVRYGGRIVNPKECKYFVLESESTLRNLYIQLCNRHPEWYCTGEYLRCNHG